MLLIMQYVAHKLLLQNYKFIIRLLLKSQTDQSWISSENLETLDVCFVLLLKENTQCLEDTSILTSIRKVNYRESSIQYNK
ncbi:unnamed protein product [Schistosoma margrebowiei]|uniref:Uncharacterized protein n=1 Tax=Schistosoma margrebowiei TaxID=48269 RepID=A0AA84ZLZ6_9TREM|nr:unnamed protein product [Schistosoma margrebowiei]